MKRLLGGALVAAGILSAFLAVIALTGALAALTDRMRFGRGLMFADVEILGMLTLLLAAAAAVLICVGRKLVRRRPEGS